MRDFLSLGSINYTEYIVNSDIPSKRIVKNPPKVYKTFGGFLLGCQNISIQNNGHFLCFFIPYKMIHYFKQSIMFLSVI